MAPLNSLQLEAAELLARGKGEVEVANACGKSRSWVQGLKRRDDFQLAVEAARNRASQAIADESRKAIVNDLAQFRVRFATASDLLYESATKYLEKINQRIDELCIDEISPMRLSQALKSGADVLVVALEVHKAALGLDEVIQEVDEIKKISQSSFNSISGYQSTSNGIEAN